MRTCEGPKCQSNIRITPAFPEAIFATGKKVCSKCCIEVGSEGTVWCNGCYLDDSEMEDFQKGNKEQLQAEKKPESSSRSTRPSPSSRACPSRARCSSRMPPARSTPASRSSRSTGCSARKTDASAIAYPWTRVATGAVVSSANESLLFVHVRLSRLISLVSTRKNSCVAVLFFRVVRP